MRRGGGGRGREGGIEGNATRREGSGEPEVLHANITILQPVRQMTSLSLQEWYEIL